MNEHPDPEQHWRHRRTMAYISLTGIVISLGAALAGIVSEPTLPLIEGLCWVLGVIVVGYYGNNAIESFAKARK